MSKRRGACPALSAPMQTGDGLLIRLSPMSGGLSPTQLVGLCEAASRHGNGIAEVTARGSLQFRGFDAKSAAAFANDVNDLDIDVRKGVPVEVSPLAGMEPVEVANPLPVAEAIRRGIGESGLASRLGPKVSVVVDGGGQISLDAISADVRLVAERLGDAIVWAVSIAGDAGTAVALGCFNEARAVQIALRILTAIAVLGRGARAVDVKTGPYIRRFGSAAPPSVLPDISPTRGEINTSSSPASISNVEEVANTKPQLISPFEREMSGRTEGGAAAHNSRMAPRDVQTSNPPVFSLTGHRHALPISLPFGHAETYTLSTLARAAKDNGVADIRPALGRSLLLICDRLADVEPMQQEAKHLGFITDPSDPRKNIAACPGAPACVSGKIAARAIAAKLAQATGDNTGVSIHISGCEKGCARQAPADITIVGGENGAGLVVNGTPKATPLAYRSAKGLPEAIAAVAKVLETRKGALVRARRVADKPGASALPAKDIERLAAAFEQAGR